MTKAKYRGSDLKRVRDLVRESFLLADQILDLEKKLIFLLKEIDTHNYYGVLGYYSLRSFCNKGLRFSKTQSQRITTEVRRIIWADQK